MTRKKIKQLNIFLLKHEFSDPQSALKEPDKLEKLELVDGLAFSGALYFKNPAMKQPNWIKFLQDGIRSSFDDIKSISHSAILFVQSDAHCFAITFGYGRTLLKTESYENNFGLKIVLNTVDPERLRSMDLQRFEEMTVQRRTQTSRGSDLTAFGIDVSQDFLKAVTGEPRNQDFAIRVTGADSLTLNARLSFQDLGSKCSELLQAYQKEDYKHDFGWIDNLSVVKNKTAIEKLNDLLIEALKKQDLDKMYLCPPETIDWQHVKGFKYSVQFNDEIYAEPDVKSYLSFLRNLDELSLEDLKKHSLELYAIESDNAIKQWSIYNSLIFEIRTSLSPESLYVFSNGTWFQADPQYAEQIHQAVEQIELIDLNLPNSLPKEHEDTYNKRAVKENSDKLCLLDRTLFTPNSASSKIEFCDLLSQERDIIHVKKKDGGSSVLSHLFAQGVVSAETFLVDGDFRQQIANHLQSSAPNFAEVVTTAQPNPSEYRIVFAVIGKTGKNHPNKLPFFSQLNLMQVTQRLKNLLRFNVAYAPIDVKEEGS